MVTGFLQGGENLVAGGNARCIGVSIVRRVDSPVRWPADSLAEPLYRKGGKEGREKILRSKNLLPSFCLQKRGWCSVAPTG